MRFSPESNHGANAGLQVARDLLEPIKARHPNVSYADLWTFAAVVAIEAMGGPKIPWRNGRSDASSPASCPPDGRLPDASRGSDHIRAIFYRMVLSSLILSSSHLFIFSSSHLFIFIFSSLHLLISSSSDLLIFSSSHLLISSSSHLLIFSSSHLLIFSSSHLLIFSSSHLLISSSLHLLISSSPHLLIF